MDRATLSLIRKTIISGVLIIPFTPLIVADSLFFPFVTGKAFFFRLIVGILFLLWAVLVYKDESFRPKRSAIAYALAFLVLVLGLATLFGANLQKSWGSNFERMEGFVMYLYLAMYFVVAISMLTTEKIWKWFWGTSSAASIIVAIYAFNQFRGAAQLYQGDRIEGTLGNATYLAVYALFHAFIGAYWGTRANSTQEKIFFWGVSALNFVVLFFTATRGAVAGLLVGVVVALILFVLLDGRKKVRRYGIGALVFLMLIGGGIFMARDSSFVQSNRTLERLSNISLEQATIRSRLMIWNMAWEGFKERPLLGWGPENFTYVFDKHYNPAMYDQEPWFDRAHNVFLDWLVSGGIVGPFAYLLLFLTTFYYLFRSMAPFSGNSFLNKVKEFVFKEKEKDLWPILILVGLLVSYFVQNIFVFDNLSSLILFFSLLAYIHTKYSQGEKEINILSSKKERTVFLFGAVIFSLTLLYTTAYKPYQANKEVIRALSERSATSVSGNLERFKSALSYKTTGTGEIREQLYNFAVSVYKTPEVPENERIAFVELALAEGKKQVEENPLDARTALLYGQFLLNINDGAGAEEYVKKAQELSPQKQTILMFLGSIYIREKKYQDAANVFDESYALFPQNDEAALLSAVGKILTGKKSDAQALLKKELGREVYPDERLIFAYLDVRDTSEARKIWNSILTERPEAAEQLKDIVLPALGL